MFKKKAEWRGVYAKDAEALPAAAVGSHKIPRVDTDFENKCPHFENECHHWTF